MFYNKKENSGMALMGAILLMFVLVALGYAMIELAKYETDRELHSRWREKAFYVADAGMERAIHRILDKKIGSFEVNVGTNTGDLAGVADVAVEYLGDRTYRITSTGYSPSISSSKADRTVQALAEVAAELPGYACMTGGQSTFAAEIYVYGIVYSMEPIDIKTNVTFKPDDDGNVAIYGADGTVDSITIGTNFAFDPDNEATGVREILARGGIQNSGNIPAGVHWKENVDPDDPDYEKVEPIEDVLFVDADELIQQAIDDGTVNHTFGGEFSVTDDRIIIDKPARTTLELDGGVYYYPNGAEFKSNLDIKGEGTIVVGGEGQGGYDHGILMDSNVEMYDDDSRVNLIVAGGTWNEYDILINQNVGIKGIIQAPGDIKIAQLIEFEGILATDGNLVVESNVEFQYSDDMFDVPLKDGESGGVTFLSWTEL